MRLKSKQVRVKCRNKPNLYGVRVTGLSQDFQKSGVRDKEEPREHETFLFQVAVREQWTIPFTFNIKFAN